MALIGRSYDDTVEATWGLARIEAVSALISPCIQRHGPLLFLEFGITVRNITSKELLLLSPDD